jgi:DNA primase
MTILEIKAQLSIEQVLRHYGDEVKGTAMRCPFHEDKSASMKVYFDTNVVRCFSGNCQHSGKTIDQIDYIMYRDNLNKHEAILEAGRQAGLEPIQKQVQIKTPKTPSTLTLEDVFKYMQNGFSRTRSAQEYAAKRGLDFLNLEIGYSSGQMHYKKDVQYLSDLEALQIIKPLSPVSGQNATRGSGYLTFAKNGIIFPLKDSAGQVCSLYGRSIDKKGHYYLTGRCGLYPGYPPRETNKVLLVESVIDAATLLQIKELSDYFILALYGTNGLTAEHKTALQALPNLEEVVLMLDGDEAGRKAASQYQSELGNLFPSSRKLSGEVKRIELPESSDVNELWVNHQEPKLFLDLLESSVNTELQALELTPEVEKVAPLKNNYLDSSNPYDWRWDGACGNHSIKGGVDLKHWEQLKVTWVLELPSGQQSRQKFDLYDDRQVEKVCREAGQKLRLSPGELEKDLNKLVGLLEQHRQALAQVEKAKSSVISNFTVSVENRAKAIAFLSEGNLLQRLNESIGLTGIVGEEHSRLMLLIIASSYKNKRPLHALIQGSSGSGKTLLLRKIMQLLPPDDRYIWSRVTDSSLYNWGDRLRYKAIGIEDWDGLTEDAQYALRELQTGGELRSSTSEKQDNGKIEGQEKVTSGPIATLMCTTRGTVYEDNMNRCFLLAVDESSEQTRRIIDYQNADAEGKIDREAGEKNTFFIQTMLKVLEPCRVVNPYASKVQLPPKAQKLRRLNQLYQDFVSQVVWWHQYQRKKDAKGRIIATPSDLQAAAALMFDSIVLKVDELDGSLRQFFELLKAFVLKKEDGKEAHFGRLEVRQQLRLSKTAQHRFFKELEDLEYIKMTQYNRYRGHQYQITYWDDYQGLRAEIKASLKSQIEGLK